MLSSEYTTPGLVFPARAGMSPHPRPGEAFGGRFPRASGDEPPTSMPWTHKSRVFPARAGMSPDPPGDLQRHRGFPRASGDEPSSRGRLFSNHSFSPRERG